MIFIIHDFLIACYVISVHLKEVSRFKYRYILHHVHLLSLVLSVGGHGEMDGKTAEVWELL